MPTLAYEYYTYEDYKHWKGDWELINGVAYAMAPSPVKSHQYIVSMLAYEMNKTLNCDECDVLVEMDYKVSEDTVLRPDVVLSCDDDGEKYLIKAPKIIFEIISPSTARRDEEIKFQKIIFEIISPSTARRDEEIKFQIYEEEKVEFLGFVYVDDLRVKLYKNIDGKFKKIGDFSKEIFDFGICGVKVDFNNIFKKFRKGIK